MNRSYLQALALLLGTVATTFVATEWRWDPASAGNYLVFVGPAAPAATDGIGTTAPPPGHEDPARHLTLN